MNRQARCPRRRPSRLAVAAAFVAVAAAAPPRPAGAATPADRQVAKLVERLRSLSGEGDRVPIDTLPAVDEDVVFQLPSELREGP